MEDLSSKNNDEENQPRLKFLRYRQQLFREYEAQRNEPNQKTQILRYILQSTLLSKSTLHEFCFRFSPPAPSSPFCPTKILLCIFEVSSCKKP